MEGVVQLAARRSTEDSTCHQPCWASGYIIGLNTAVVVFSAARLGGWSCCRCINCSADQPDALTGVAAAKTTWSGQIRYIGIGAMLVGGVWTLFQVRGPILQSLRQLIALYGIRRQDRPQSYCRVPSVTPVSAG